MQDQKLMVVKAKDFCCGLVFALDPPICIRAAPKLEVFLNKSLDKVISACKQQGWKYEII